VDVEWQHKQSRDVSKSPNKSFLFLLTDGLTPELDCPEMGLVFWERQPLFGCFGVLLLSLEIPAT
jgi:hypothetical protein